MSRKRMIQEVRFKGREYLLLGEKSGPLCTRKQFFSFSRYSAILNNKGQVVRDGKILGTLDDLEIIKDVSYTILDEWNNYRLPGKLAITHLFQRRRAA